MDATASTKVPVATVLRIDGAADDVESFVDISLNNGELDLIWSLPECPIATCKDQLGTEVDKQQLPEILPIRRDTGVALVDCIQRFIDTKNKQVEREDSLTSQQWKAERRRCHRVLKKLSNRTNILPHTLFLRDIDLKDRNATSYGGFADVFRASHAGRIVALKRPRAFCTDFPKHLDQTRRDLIQESLLWRILCHPYVLPFYGLDDITFSGMICMVSPWMKNGNVLLYVSAMNGDTSMIHRLLCEVAQGLAYLHEQSVVHGDLKGTNVLINDSGHVQIADFGLAVISTNTATAGTTDQRGSTRWMAPEMALPSKFSLNSNEGRSCRSDVYAFGCMCLELFTGDCPFASIRNEMEVMLKVIDGVRPNRPTDAELGDKVVMDDMWSLIQECWYHDHEKRPSIHQVLSALISFEKSGSTTDDQKTSKERHFHLESAPAETPGYHSSQTGKDDTSVSASALCDRAGAEVFPSEDNIDLCRVSESMRDTTELVELRDSTLHTLIPAALDLELKNVPPVPLPQLMARIEEARTPMEPHDATSTSLASAWAVPPKVLLVDDDKVNRKLASKFLQVLGYRTDVAADGVSAVRMMNLHRYDLVLMDIMMPKLDGVSATSLIRQFDNLTPIISMTGASTPSQIMSYYSSGMNDILAKPFTKDELFHALDRHLIHLKKAAQNKGNGSGVHTVSRSIGDSSQTSDAETIANASDGKKIPSGSGTEGQYGALLQTVLTTNKCVNARSKRLLDDEADVWMAQGKRARLKAVG